MNDRGDILFHSGVEGGEGGGSALFKRGSNGEVTMVVRAGTSTGLDGIDYSLVSDAVMNDRGQVAIDAFIEGTGIDFSNNRAVFAENQTGDLDLIVRQSQLIDVSDDPLQPHLRAVRFLSFNTGRYPDYLPSDGFNSRGQLAFYATFDDGRGVFVSSAVSIPEPSTLAVAFLAMIWLAVWGYRRC